MKKIAVMIFVLFLLVALMPPVSQASVTPYFMAVNDDLLPFTAANMPYVAGSDIFVPHVIFRQVGVWETASAAAERVRLYRGGETFVDFYTSTGVTEDQNGTLAWPSAHRIGSTFYLPLRQVCSYFGLSFEILDVRRETIPEEQMRVIRILQPNMWVFNGATFLGYNSRAIRSAYNDYFQQPPRTPETEPPEEEPQLTFSDVTMHLSFYDLNAGGANLILDTFDDHTEADSRLCFFVSAEEIAENPGLVRRISGVGHTVGLWLEEGTLEEYHELSALLFEAAKIRTVLISADEAAETAMETAENFGLVFWSASSSFQASPNLTESQVTNALPTVGGERQLFRFACSENVASVLPGVLAHLREFEYVVAGITETTEPVHSH